MKKLSTVLFILVGLVIIFLVIRENINFDVVQNTIQGYTNQPSIVNDQSEILTNEALADTENISVLVSLNSNEVVVAAVSVDFNLDSYVDQIVAVKDSESPYIKVIIGLYNPLFGSHDRSREIETEIEQTRTFSIDVIDITGTHENSLIISGIAESNESILQVWLSRTTSRTLNLDLIANIKAEGTIFVNQTPRNSSYYYDTENDTSFPIWVYTADPSSVEGSLDQLQIMYDWNSRRRQYEQVSETRILGRTINAQELSRIQDGTEKTFGNFLSTTWRTVSPSEISNPYIAFNYENKTITFLNNGTAEEYVWETSILRRNGIFISTTNKNLSTVVRRIDITLISVDEIRVKVTDALHIAATPLTTWDGNYKKQAGTNLGNFTTAVASNDQSKADLLRTLKTPAQKVWEADNGYFLTFSDTTYTANDGDSQETGAFTIFNVYSEQVMQIKSDVSSSTLTGFYRISSEDTNQTDGTVQVRLIPVEIGATDIVTSLSQPIVLELKDR